ncbi:MAG: hypothetical protein WCS94_16850 [Verrucomicrobiota bacterium]
MAQAQVTSVEAIELFRAKFIVFLAQARNVLEEASNEVVRMRPWLQDEKRMFWEQELRRRERRLEEAKQELFNATLSKFHETIALHRMAVQRTQQSVREVEAKMSVLKKWDRELENRSTPLLKQLEQLHGFLTTDMTRAVAFLDQTLKTLAAYHDVAPAGGQKTAPAAPAKTEEPT